MRRFLAPLTAIGTGLLVITVFLALSSEDPAGTLRQFFTRPFSSWWHLGNMLNMAGLLALAATGSAIALKSGSFNLGGEAQIYAPGLITALILAAGRGPEPSVIGGMAVFAGALAAAVIAGALLAFVPALLKARANISELLSSFLLSAALLPVLDYLVGGPLRDQSKNLLATPPIAAWFRIHPLARPSLFNVSFFVAAGLAVIAGVILRRTGPGYRLRVTGIAPDFARFAGFPANGIAMAGMSLSGALHGLTGFFAITGTWYVCHQGLSGGMGWSALAAALIARQNPFAVIPSALLLAWLETATDSALLSTRFGFDSTSIVQAVILLVISARALPLGPANGRAARGKPA